MNFARLAAKATPGPWEFHDRAPNTTENHTALILTKGPRNGKAIPHSIAAMDSVSNPNWQADAQYLAAISPDQLLALIAERDRLAADLKEAARQTIADLGQLQEANTTQEVFGDCPDVPERLVVTEFGDGCFALFVVGEQTIAHLSPLEMIRLSEYLAELAHDSKETA